METRGAARRPQGLEGHRGLSAASSRLHDACETGDVARVCNTLRSIRRHDDEITYSACLRSAVLWGVISGRMTAVEYLLREFHQDDDDRLDTARLVAAALYACQAPMATMLWKRCQAQCIPDDAQNRMTCGSYDNLPAACRSGYIDLAKEMVSHAQAHHPRVLSQDVGRFGFHNLTAACVNALIHNRGDFVVWLREQGIHDFRIGTADAFKFASLEGSLELMKEAWELRADWHLFTERPDPVNIMFITALQNACRARRMALVRWLVTLCPVPIEVFWWAAMWNFMDNEPEVIFFLFMQYTAEEVAIMQADTNYHLDTDKHALAICITVRRRRLRLAKQAAHKWRLFARARKLRRLLLVARRLHHLRELVTRFFYAPGPFLPRSVGHPRRVRRLRRFTGRGHILVMQRIREAVRVLD